jgi:hypothetical protein
MPWSWLLLPARRLQARLLLVLLVPQALRGQQPELARSRWLRTRSSHPCGLGTPHSCSHRSSRTRHYKAQ